MMASADIVIIGGGIVGASVAYHLAEAGCPNVLILEREPQQGLGSTGKATGGVRAQFATPINIQMSLYSIDFFANFEDATGYTAGYQPHGYLFVATTPGQLDHLRANRLRQIESGLKNVEIVTAGDIAAILPQLNVDDVAGGAFCQTDGFVRPLGVMKAFTARACERGVRLWLDTQVTGIEVSGGHVS